MVPPIVIGAHPKRKDEEPIELALKLSRLTRAPIDVVGTFWFDTTPQRTASDEYGRALAGEVQRALEQVVGDTERACGEVRTHVMPGSAARALQEKASEVGAGLIIVGSTLRGAVGRITAGTTADRVIEHAPCPVAVVPRGFRDDGAGVERVGVAFVDTPGGHSALRAAAAMARRTGASLVAYTVIEPHTDDEDRRRAERAVEQAISECADDIGADARVLTKGGVEELVQASRELDFLVRGSRSRGPVRPPLAFGLPSKLARNAACPFVVVPPGREEPLVELFRARAGAGREEALSS